jgi:hypothetical protein
MHLLSKTSVEMVRRKGFESNRSCCRSAASAWVRSPRPRRRRRRRPPRASAGTTATATLVVAATSPWWASGSVALLLCTTARLLHTRFANIFGACLS